MESLAYLSAEDVRRHLRWEGLTGAIEHALAQFSKDDASVVQPPRLITRVPDKNGALLTMPCYNANDDSLGCKVVTSFLKNQQVGLPSIMANILLLDPNTGQLRAIIEGSEITGWRTAAASVVATKHLHKGEKAILAILGAGAQAKSHAIALQHTFNFQQVRIWNHRPERAKLLVQQLGDGSIYKWYESSEQCVKDADVVCAATYATEPILFYKWLKKGVHINAIGAGLTHHSELDKEIYEKCIIVTDSMAAAQKELAALLETGVHIAAEIGQIINGVYAIDYPQSTVFQSLGMAVEDIVAAELVYKSYMEEKELQNKLTPIKMKCINSEL